MNNEFKFPVEFIDRGYLSDLTKTELSVYMMYLMASQSGELEELSPRKIADKLRLAGTKEVRGAISSLAIKRLLKLTNSGSSNRLGFAQYEIAELPESSKPNDLNRFNVIVDLIERGTWANMSGAEKALFVAYVAYATEEPRLMCRLSVVEMASIAGLSHSAVLKANSMLQERCLITREWNGERSAPALTEIVTHYEIDRLENENNLPINNSSLPKGTYCHVDNDDPNINADFLQAFEALQLLDHETRSQPVSKQTQELIEKVKQKARSYLQK